MHSGLSLVLQYLFRGRVMYQTTRGSQAFLSPQPPGIKQPSLLTHIQDPQGCFKMPVYLPEASSTCPRAMRNTHSPHFANSLQDEAEQSRGERQVYLLARWLAFSIYFSKIPLRCTPSPFSETTTPLPTVTLSTLVSAHPDTHCHPELLDLCMFICSHEHSDPLLPAHPGATLPASTQHYWCFSGQTPSLSN